ncbi:MAG: glycosyltransferase family 4 protein [Microcoleaceae cyanobacterium]
MKIAYVTVYDVLNQHKWPTTQLGLCQAGYTIAKTLESQSVDIEYVGGLKKKISLKTRAKWEFYKRFHHKDYYRWAEPLIVKDYGKQVQQQLAKIDYDVILCPENVVSISQLNCQKPMVLWTDAPLSALINFYPYLSNLCQETLQNIYQLEKAALDKCNLAIYTSEWAAKYAIKDYQLNPDKVKVVSFGANLANDQSTEEIEHQIQSRSSTICRLLFIGVEWWRKGGHTALKVVEKLNQQGLKTELFIVGCQPNIASPLPDFVKVIGYINKFAKEGKEKLTQLLSSSHFLILPSMAETYGHVLCEANSFGVPCLTTNVGGLSSVIHDNINGKTFSPTANISDYCDYITYHMNHFEAYQALAHSAYHEYQSRLNWEVACKTVKTLIANLV